MRRVAIAFAFVLSAAAAHADEPAAMVEDATAGIKGVEFMDYLPAGRIIELAPSDTLVLSYLSSCWRETIAGGTVTVGVQESRVAGGKVQREKVACDGKLQLTSEQAAKSGTMVFRSAPRPNALPVAEVTLYGLSPLVELKGGGKVTIERLDRAGERLELDLPAAQLQRGAYYDLAKSSQALAPGGLYRATAGARQVVFKVDPHATGGQGPLVGRLLRLSAS